jgi:hypothetical protein
MLDTSEEVAQDAFRVKLYLSEDKLEVATFDGDSWQWDSDTAQISRVKAGRFRLDLGDEELFFLPDDPIKFTLNTSPGEDTRGNSPQRGWLRRKIEEAAATDVEVEAPSYEPDVAIESRKDSHRRRGSHSHTWEETATAGVARKRCTECGHVSIDLSGVHSAFESGPLSA